MATSQTNKKRLLHIHQDYPDGRPYVYTKAVSHLIHEVNARSHAYEHFVVSIHRTLNPFKVSMKRFDDGVSLVYWGAPLPYIHLFSLWLLAQWILWIIRSDPPFDGVHGHKLTTEGYVAGCIARQRNRPLLISIRGGSDQKNVNRFPMHAAVFRRIFTSAQVVFWVSPWLKPMIEDRLKVAVTSPRILPNICDIDLNVEPVTTQCPKKLTVVLNYNQHKRKGIHSIIMAYSLAGTRHVNLPCVEVYGYGSQAIREHLEAEVDRLGLTDQFQFFDAIAQPALRKRLAQSLGLLLPAKNETFGMSYIEALSVHCPIMYMAQTGIDGFFDGYNVGVKLQGQEVEHVYKGICELVDAQACFKENIAQMHRDGYLEKFTADDICKAYIQALDDVFLGHGEKRR